MTIYHVGGIRLNTFRGKDVIDFIESGVSGDTFMLHRKKTVLEHTLQVKRSIKIIGDGKIATHIYIKKGSAGFYVPQGGSLVLKNVTLHVDRQANGISVPSDDDVPNLGRILLENVAIIYDGNFEPDERYPLISIASPARKEGQLHVWNRIKLQMSMCEVSSMSVGVAELSLSYCSISDGFPGRDSTLMALSTKVENCHVDNATFRHLGTRRAEVDKLTTTGNLVFHGFWTMRDMTIKRPRVLDLPKGAALVAQEFERFELNLSYVAGLLFFGHKTLKTHATIERLRVNEDVVNDKTAPYDFGLFYIDGEHVQVDVLQSSLPHTLAGSVIKNARYTLDNVKDKEQYMLTNAKIEARLSTTSLPLGDIEAVSTADLAAAEPTKDALTQLDELTGLGNVKKVIHQMVSMAAMNEERKRRGLKTTSGLSLHTVFAGSAGTGKTTVAELYAKALFERGVLRTPKFIEATRKDLVAGYIGQTGPKTREVIQSALGGVLFIDEAYSLASQSESDFASEAVAQLIADMESNRDDLVVILAGYTHEMKDFIMNGNPGLQSRFTNWVTFEDYTSEELVSIFHDQLRRQDTYPGDDNATRAAEQSLVRVFDYMQLDDPTSTGNGRFVRNYVQALLMAMNARISMADMTLLDDSQMTSFIREDVMDAERSLMQRHAQMRM